jgi:iron(III) transport system permease protein
MLFGNNGFISSTLLGLNNPQIYGFRGLLFAQVLTFFPVAYITLRGVLESISPTLEDAAMDLGGSKWKIFLKVTLPLAIPGIASAMLVLFVESLADFGNPLILAGSKFPILSVQAYLEITGMYNLPRGAALAFVLLIPSVSAFFLQKYWVSKKQYITVTGKPTSSSNSVVSPSARWILFGVVCLFSAMILLIYLTILWGAFAKTWGFDNSLTLKNFSYVFSVGFNAVKQTIIIAGLSTPVSGVIGMIIAFLVVRKNFPGKRFMELTSMLSFAIPGTVIGIGYILAFNQRPLYLTGTLAILLLNFIFRYLPVGIQSGVAVLRQIDPSIEEAAVDLGADASQTFRKITLPLMIPAFFSGLIFAFVRGMTAISAAIFLVSSRWNFMTVQIMSQVESGRLGAAAAFSVILVGIILVAILVIRLLLRWRYGQTTSSILTN